MKLRQIGLLAISACLAAFGSFSVETFAQSGSGESILPTADKAFNACAKTEDKNFRAFAINVAKQSPAALAVAIAVGTGSAIDSLPALTFSVHPLSIETDESGKMTFTEVGNGSTLSKPRATRSEDGERIFIKPSIVIPVAENVSAVRVDVKGLFGHETVSSITVKTEGETAGCVTSAFSLASAN